MLEQAGLDASKYCSLGFQIDVATTASTKGIEESLYSDIL